MAITINGTANTVAGLAEGGLPNGTVLPADLKASSGTAGSGTYYRGDGAWGTISSVGGATGTDYNDNVKVRFGTGTDLEIYHDGTDSYIDSETGVTYIRPDGNLQIKDLSSGEVRAAFNNNGAAELYHDGTKTVETDANGIKFADGKGLTLGTDGDMTVRHSSTTTTFNRPVSGAVVFNWEDNDATTNIPLRMEKTGDAVNSVRHSMFSFGLPGSNNGVAQCGSSASETPIWSASSDYRIKENFRPYTGGWDAIKAIPVQLYDEKAPSYLKGVNKKDRKGWKAHEVQAVIPDAVTGTKDEVVTQAMIDSGQYQQSELNNIIPQQLGTTAMLPDVIGALQQAMTKIETLETKVAALEAA